MLDGAITGGHQLARLVESCQLVKDLDGEIWECGVYLGGSAWKLLENSNGKVLRLFDTFGPGIPIADPDPNIDGNVVGSFKLPELFYESTILPAFKPYPQVKIHKGIIPATFYGLKNCKIALAHLDIDSGQTYTDCLKFIWPRLVSGGIIQFDDYAVSNCNGATIAVDAFINKYNLKLERLHDHGAWVIK